MPYIGKSPTPVPLSASDLDDDVISLAKMASGTDGNIITYDASGNPVAVATGDDGQVLTSAGAGNPCLFEAAAAGGAWTKLASTTIAGATAEVDFTGCFSSTYKVYKVFITELTQTNSSYSEKRLQLLVGDSVEEDANGYKTREHWNSNSSATADTHYTAARQSADGYCLNGNQGYFSNIPKSISGEVTIYNPNSNTNNTVFISSVWQHSTTGPYRQHHKNSGEYDSLASATGLRFRTHDDTDVHAGTIDIYGLATGA